MLAVLVLPLLVSLAGLDERTLRDNPQWLPPQTSVAKAVEFRDAFEPWAVHLYALR